MHSLSFVALLLAVCASVHGAAQVEVTVSKTNVDPGETVTVTCKIKDSTEQWQFDKAVWSPTKNERGEEQYLHEELSSNSAVHIKYKETGRYSRIKESNDGPWKLYTLTIKNANQQDTGYYMCSIVGTEIRAIALMEVYTMPTEITFVNHTETDVIDNTLTFDVDEKKDFACIVTGVTPVPIVKLKAGDNDYTNKVSDSEFQLDVPDCWTNRENACLLHHRYTMVYRVTDFRPSLEDDGKQLICQVTLEGSKQEPEGNGVGITMQYKPYFECEEYQKVILGKRGGQLKCMITSNPALKTDMVTFRFTIDDQTTTLHTGKSYGEGRQRIAMTTKKQTDAKKTQVILTFAEVMKKHRMKYTLSAANNVGSNTTTINMVDTDFVPSAASTYGLSAVFALTSLLTTVLSQL